ncbi:MAG TPA: LysR family transcriptional regulator, partial [Xanthobacteraceae bacterium]
MELRHLQEFISIINHGSLSDAARALRLPQPTLTRDIKLLESAVGGALFVRTRYGMRLTQLGTALEPRARTIVGEVDRSYREMTEMKAGQVGRVVIGTALGFSQAVLPQALAQFRLRYPRIQVTVLEGLFPDILPGLKSGDIDYAFFSSSALRDEDLRGEVLLPDEPVMVVTRSQNPIASKRRLSLKDIRNEPWAVATKPES